MTVAELSGEGFLLGFRAAPAAGRILAARSAASNGIAAGADGRQCGLARVAAGRLRDDQVQICRECDLSDVCSGQTCMFLPCTVACSNGLWTKKCISTGYTYHLFMTCILAGLLCR